MTDFEIRSAAGALMFTTPDLDLARGFAREKAAEFPGVTIWSVERVETRRRVWSDRRHLRLVGAA